MGGWLVLLGLFRSLQWRHKTHDNLTIVYSAVYSRHRLKKTKILRVIGLCEGIHRWPVNIPHKGPITRNPVPYLHSDVARVSVSWALLQYFLKLLTVRAREVSKPRDFYLELFNRQHCCRCVCHIWNRCDIWNYQHRDFTRPYDKTFYRILKRGPGHQEFVKIITHHPYGPDETTPRITC